MANISKLKEELDNASDVVVLDVRTPAEFRGCSIPEALNIPLHELEKRASEIPKNKKLYVICGSGNRSSKACELLSRLDFKEADSVEGGMKAWEENGYETKEGKSGISIERQVRIAAGSLVLLGVLLSVTVSPAFIWLSGFVGAGLIFAGVTDFCGMGLLLARMPWNK